MPPAANKSAAAKASPSPAAAPATTTAGSDPIANDKMVWDLFKSKNYDAFAALLASDFIEVEPDKVSDKAGSVVGVSQFDASKAVLSDWKAVRLDDDASLVTYLAKDARGQSRHSTVWVNRGGKWMGLMHIGTEIRKAGVHPEPK